MTAEQKQLWKAIDKILWEDWDPIGVNDYGGPDDEYRDYLPQIFQLKLKGASKEAIAHELYKNVTLNMGLSGDKDHCLKIAEKIINL